MIERRKEIEALWRKVNGYDERCHLAGSDKEWQFFEALYAALPAVAMDEAVARLRISYLNTRHLSDQDERDRQAVIAAIGGGES